MAWELAGNSGTDPGTNFLGTTDGKPLAIQPGNGNVGIGTSSPSSKVEIAAQDGLAITGFQPFLTLKDSNSGFARARIQTANGELAFFNEASFASGIPPMKITPSGTVEIVAQDALKIVGFQPFITLVDSNSGFARARIQTANGELAFFNEASFASGIPPMKITPSGTVEIVAQDALKIVGFQPFITLVDSNSGFARARIQTANGELAFFNEASFASGIPPMKITPSGNVEVTGDIQLTSADCAEDFNIGGTDVTVDAGTVMVVGEGGALFPSQHIYDKRVAGVISGAGDYKPAIVLDKQNAEGNRQSIALLGKVYCKVDAQYGVIEVGDLLTTSATPGHAMKADDPAKAFGAVLGKALHPLDKGQELIPILVTLQ